MLAAFLLVCAGAFLLVANMTTPEMVLGGFLVAGGGVLLWGSPRVVIHTVHGNRAAMTGLPWTHGEARQFAHTVRAAYQEFTGITLLVCEPGQHDEPVLQPQAAPATAQALPGK